MKSDKTTDKLLEEILVDAYGEDEQLWAFRQVIEDEVPLPADGSVIGEPVSVVKIDCDGNSQQGLRATCKKADGKSYEVALEDVKFPEGSKALQYSRAYCHWLGIPVPTRTRRSLQREKIKQTKALVGQIDISQPVDLIVLGIKQQENARCRVLATGKELTLRSGDVWDVVPGEIVTIAPKKHWSYAGHPYLSGEITNTRFDLAALGLTPLKLKDCGIYDPKDQCWGENGEPMEEWAQDVIKRGLRPQYEMEQLIPDVKPEDLDIDTDPILKAVELREAGEFAKADRVLTGMLIADLRCLDAHAHLGNLDFDHDQEKALRHYDIGRQIGELSLGQDFAGVLPWVLIDNRPYLRCLQGYSLCLWRLKRFDEAADVFARMLWLNPSDNQGARFLIKNVRAGKPWEECEDL